MRILVTGGAGFIGSHLVDALVKAKHTVRVLDNFDPQVHQGSRPDYLNPAAEYVGGDVRNRDTVRKALSDMEVLFHEAAAVGVGQSMYAIEHYTSVNVLGTATLLDIIVNEHIPLKKMIVASSMSIYGEGLYKTPAGKFIYPRLRDNEQMAASQWEMRCPETSAEAMPQPTPETKPLIPTSVYAVTKRDQEELFLAVGESYRIPTVALRYFNVYGPRQSLSNPYTGVCAIFSSQIKNGDAPLIYEDGNQTRDFTHVRDIVQANLLVMQDPRADYQVFNVGTGKPTSIKQIALLLAKLYGSTVQPNIVGKFRAGDIRHCYADIAKLKALGFQPFLDLEEGLRELVAWGSHQKAVNRVAAANEELAARGLAR
jgi:dTDP-L-rhamnose 4-epimerase